jgi:hypothetical protein
MIYHLRKRTRLDLGALAHACNPTLGGLWLEANPGKKLETSHLKEEAKHGVVHTYNPNYVGSISRRNAVQEGNPR